jgi:hypothetical protein
MSIAKTAAPNRAALTKAIEDKVERMDLAGLVRLAGELKVQIPGAARARQARVRKLAPRAKVNATVLKGSGIGRVVSAAEGARLIDEITIDDDSGDWADSELLGTGELALRLKVVRGTVDNWRKSRKIVAFKKGLRNFIYPLAQFERRGPIEGIEQVIPLFESDEDAWEWLVAPNRMTGLKRPLDALRKGEVEKVTKAAEGALDYA